jgi:hypothetical protein
MSIVLKESDMNKDSKLIWVVEYLIGIGFLVAVLPFILHPQPGWSAAHGWAYLLFIACAGIALISSASGTRQRLELSKRIEELEKKLNEQKSAQNQTQHTGESQFISKEQLVGSVN